MKRWTVEPKLGLQKCFDYTDWSVFKVAAMDLNERTDTVASYISFYEDSSVQTKTFYTYNNNKQWFNTKLQKLRQAKYGAYRSGNRVLYKHAWNTMMRDIGVAERSYSERLKSKFSASNPATYPPSFREQTTGRRIE